MQLIINEKDLNLVTGRINKAAAAVIGGLIGFTVGVIFVVTELVVYAKIKNKIVNYVVDKRSKNLYHFTDDEMNKVTMKAALSIAAPLCLLTLGGCITSGVLIANKIYKKTHKTNNK